MGKKISDFNLIPSNLLTGDEQLPAIDLTKPNLSDQNIRVTIRSILAKINLADLGLDQVDNTSDLNKPLSTAMIAALAGKANTVHTHAKSDIIGLVDDLLAINTALANKSNVGHTHAIADVIGLQAALDGKAALVHTHNYTDINGLDQHIIDVVSAGNIDGIGDVIVPVIQW